MVAKRSSVLAIGAGPFEDRVLGVNSSNLAILSILSNSNGRGFYHTIRKLQFLTGEKVTRIVGQPVGQLAIEPNYNLCIYSRHASTQ